ncbi:MAG: type II toxin-antitoxin system VapB family antitoxin [Acidobacteria bacterium]|nr:MAG: type II toxin-antitoxin system VapB family antitoxin [Acidobacteriota bacterium]
MTRTNIVIDDELLEIVMHRHGLRTKTAAVDAALRALAGSPMTRTEALAMRGADAILSVPQDQPPA